MLVGAIDHQPWLDFIYVFEISLHSPEDRPGYVQSFLSGYKKLSETMLQHEAIFSRGTCSLGASGGSYTTMSPIEVQP